MKTYIKPVSEKIELAPEGMLASSPGFVNREGEKIQYSTGGKGWSSTEWTEVDAEEDF